MYMSQWLCKVRREKHRKSGDVSPLETLSEEILQGEFLKVERQE